MSNPEVIGISKYISVAGGVEEDIVLYEVPPQDKVHLRAIQIIFPAGTLGELQLYLKYGEAKVAPETDYWNGDDGKVVDLLDIVYGSQTRVVMHVKNVNPVDARTCTVKIEACRIA